MDASLVILQWEFIVAGLAAVLSAVVAVRFIPPISPKVDDGSRGAGDESAPNKSIQK